MAEPVLAIADLQGWYGDSHVLHGVSLEVTKGECVTIIGRNGAGKTTTLRAIMGMLDKRTGSIRVAGTETIAAASETIARLGVGYVPEERGIYATLDVTENLLLPPRVNDGGMSIEDIYLLFPALRERRRSPGTRLSGGEQQMLAIGRVLRTGATLFLLDEPTEGLAPVIVQQIGRAIETDEAAGPHDRSRRAELPLRGETRRPPLRHGARPHRRRDPARRGGGAKRPHQSLSRHLGDARVDASAVRAIAGRPDQRLVLRHAQPRALASSSACSASSTSRKARST